ncbi:cytoplasmic polyadenylated homeobox like isoform X2 [Tupaia chinensis]|uniref:cytoplasmic polyadenylated homeobox like isoform X2 n=1 Tax=Tupaia chinensis TaxID=246437 RepID=UPI0003C8C874|nr:cytoplasmic polyadenylated homeobox like isoform X2 [Tupaia chinensis]
MTSNGSPVEEDSQYEGKGAQCKRGKGRPRHKFTKNELHILNQSFEHNPYPDFTTRTELANQVYCNVSVIDNWFQNRRARLPYIERYRMFAARKLHVFPIETRPLLSLQGSHVESPNYTIEQGHLGRANSTSLDTHGVPSEQDGSEPSPSLEYQRVAENASNSFRSVASVHPVSSSVDSSEMDRMPGVP